MSKKVVIIGGGISGLVSGIYCLKNGMDVSLYEKNSFLGGLLVNSRQRKNTYGDSFTYFVYNDELKFLYNDIGLDNIMLDECDYFIKYNDLYLYKDLKELEEELIKISPVDEKKIKHLIKAIYDAQKCKLMYEKAIDCMSFLEMIKNSTKMSANSRLYRKYRDISVSKYFSDFYNEDIKSLFSFLKEDTSMYVLLLLLAKFSDGSLKKPLFKPNEIITLIKNKFQSLGGKIVLNKLATSIDIKNSKAIGVWFDDKHYVNADIVISALDIHHLYYDLLKNKYKDRKLEIMFEDYKTYPLYSLLNFNFLVKGDISNLPYYFMTKINRTKIGSSFVDKLQFVKRSDNIISCDVCQNSEDYIYWKLLSKNPSIYNKELNKIFSNIKNDLSIYLNDTFDDSLKVKEFDYNSVLDYEEKYNCFKSCIYSFGLNKKGSIFSFDGRINDVKDLYYCGQWLSNPGGYLNACINAYYVSNRIINDQL